jgi:hypothetical protein
MKTGSRGLVGLEKRALAERSQASEVNLEIDMRPA